MLISNKGPSYEDLKQLEYLPMVIDETLRFYSPVPLLGRKAARDIQYQGKMIPKGAQRHPLAVEAELVSLLGTFTIMCTYGLHRRPDFWEKPDEFYPEHFTVRRSVLFVVA